MEKMPPWRRLVTVPADDLSARQLAEAGMTLDSVLAEGQVAELRPFTSDEWGGTLEDVLGDIHPDNEKLAIEAARALGLNFAGVDLITRDIATAWYDNGATINEVNARPQFSTLFREVRAPALLGGLVEGDGRVPVHLVSGRGDLVEVANRLRDRLRDRGGRCHLTTSHRTEDEDGREIVFGSSSLFERSLVLAMRKDVSEIVMIGRRNELFERGLAVDVLENAFVVDDDASAADRLLGEIASRVRVKHAQAVRPGADLRLGPR
jgi:cyanophycin synthetase